jgi:hypothetical protein
VPGALEQAPPGYDPEAARPACPAADAVRVERLGRLPPGYEEPAYLPGLLPFPGQDPLELAPPRLRTGGPVPDA